MPTTITGDSGVSQIQAGATSGGLPVFQCRAWVNFDGTRDSTGALSTANTARLIRGSGNVSSVVRNNTGDYTVNFTTPMPDANYAAVGLATIGGSRLQVLSLISQTSAGVRVNTGYAGGNNDVGFVSDQTTATVTIFR